MGSPAARLTRRQLVEETIESTLAPVIGGALARGAVRAQFERAGIQGDTLMPTELDVLLGALEKGLRVFVGSPKAAALIDAVRSALREATDAR